MSSADRNSAQPSANDLDDVILQSIDGPLEQQQREELHRRIENDPVARDKFLDLQAEHRLLSQVLNNRDADFTSAVMNKILPNSSISLQAKNTQTTNRRSKASISPTPSNWWRTKSFPMIKSLIAAAIFVVLVRVSLFQPAEALGRIEGSISGITIGSVTAKEGMPITYNQSVQVTEGNAAHVRLIDGTLINLSGGSEARIERLDKRLIVHLIAGRVEAEVAHQAPGHHFSIEGNRATATAIGTRFIVWADVQEMHVTVTEGEVAVTRRSDGNALSLQQGQRVSVAEKATFAVKSERESSGEVAITGITLIDAERHLPIPEFSPLVHGATLDLAKLPSRMLNMLFSYKSAVADVDVLLEGPNKTISRQDRCRPFTMYGNTGDYYREWKPTTGIYHLTVKPIGFDQHDGNDYKISFTVVDSASK